MSNCNFGMSALESEGNVGEFDSIWTAVASFNWMLSSQPLNLVASSHNILTAECRISIRLSCLSYDVAYVTSIIAMSTVELFEITCITPGHSNVWIFS